MTRPYSVDLRERVVASVQSGRSVRLTGALFGVSASSVVKWSQRHRRTGHVRPDKMGGYVKPRLLGEREWLAARIAVEPDLTLRALLAELRERGVKVGYGALWRHFAREGLSFKKSLFAAEQDRPAIARRRAQWKKYQGRLDPSRLVFIDETWAKTNMTRTHGRSPRGQRLRAKVPHGKWRTMTFLAALRCDRIDAPCVIDGPINGQLFTAWVEQFLVPTLRQGDVVIMDNLGSHKGAAVHQAIRAAGVKLLFLPPYSPDLNPIEQVFAKALLSLSKGSRRCCARPKNAPSRRHGNASASSSTASRQPNAPITSLTPDMRQLDHALGSGPIKGLPIGLGL